MLKEQAEKLAQAIQVDILATEADIASAITRLTDLYEAVDGLGMTVRRQGWSRAIALLQEANNNVY